jgi:hypothetical protein
LRAPAIFTDLRRFDQVHATPDNLFEATDGHVAHAFRTSRKTERSFYATRGADQAKRRTKRACTGSRTRPLAEYRAIISFVVAQSTGYTRLVHKFSTAGAARVGATRRALATPAA